MPLTAPAEISVVVLFERSYISVLVSVSAATNGSGVLKKTRPPSAVPPEKPASNAPLPLMAPVEMRSVTEWLASAGAHSASTAATVATIAAKRT